MILTRTSAGKEISRQRGGNPNGKDDPAPRRDVFGKSGGWAYTPASELVRKAYDLLVRTALPARYRRAHRWKLHSRRHQICPSEPHLEGHSLLQGGQRAAARIEGDRPAVDLPRTMGSGAEDHSRKAHALGENEASAALPSERVVALRLRRLRLRALRIAHEASVLLLRQRFPRPRSQVRRSIRAAGSGGPDRGEHRRCSIARCSLLCGRFWAGFSPRSPSGTRTRRNTVASARS